MAMGRSKRDGVALGLCVAAMVVGSAVVAADSSSARVPAVGSFAADLACPADPFFPGAQNSGYDVGNYSLRFSYEPSSKRLAGLDLITATATRDLSQFDLDLRGFSISGLKVNGRAATFSREGSKVVITPNVDVLAGAGFTVRIRYAGRPSLVRDPDGSLEGWFPTADGAFVVGEPQGSPAWYPANDTPCDKATYDFSVTVPRGLTVMANGVLVSHLAARGKTSWVWRESDPMATDDLPRRRPHHAQPLRPCLRQTAHRRGGATGDGALIGKFLASTTEESRGNPAPSLSRIWLNSPLDSPAFPSRALLPWRCSTN